MSAETGSSAAAQGVPHHSAVARSNPRQQAWKWFKTFRWHLLLLFLSDYGRDIITRKYDAFTTDRAYENKASGRWGIGRLVDRLVLNQDTHVGLRERLVLVVDNLAAVCQARRREKGTAVRLVSGPCGLVRDLLLTWRRLQDSGQDPAAWLELTGLDLDFSDEVLAEAGRRAEAAAVPLRTHRQDLLDTESLLERLGRQSVDVFLSMGLTVWLSPEDRLKLLTNFHRVLAADGFLIIDNFHSHASSRYLDAFEMQAWYPTDEEFTRDLESVGFAIEQKQETSNGVNVVYRTRKRA